MTRFLRLFSGAILLALLSTVGIVCAANADLNVSKMVNSTGPYEPGDDVTWVVTLWNNGPSDATNITLQEDISRLSGHKNMTFEADTGIYNSTTHTWNIPQAPEERHIYQPYAGNRFQHHWRENQPG